MKLPLHLGFILACLLVSVFAELPSDPFPEFSKPDESSSSASSSSSLSSSSYGAGTGGGGGDLGGGSDGHTGGCSSNYWADHPSSWPSLLTLYTRVTQVLGEISYTLFGGPTTLLSALQNRSTDPYSSLLRETTAALLNSYTHPSFPYNPAAVRSAFQQSVTSKSSAAYQAALFQQANSGYGVCS